MEKSKKKKSAALDIDSLQDEFESSSEWRLRRKFLQLNSSSLNQDRLVCLSKCFINMAMYGCCYPAAVAREVSERSQGILEEQQLEKKAELKQKFASSFVKAEGPETSSTAISGTESRSVDKPKFTIPKKGVSQQEELDNSDNINFIKQPGNKNDTKVKKSTMVEEGSNNWDIKEHGSAKESSYIQNQKKWSSSSAGFDTDSSKVTAPHTTKTLPVASSSGNNTVGAISCSSGNNTVGAISCSSGNNTIGAVLSKDECLIASQNEKNPFLKKMRKLAYEAQNLKVSNQNAKEKLNSAGNRIPIAMEFKMDHIPGRSYHTFVCHVLIEGIEVACEKGLNIKEAKMNACETLLKVIRMPKIEIVQPNPKFKCLKGSLMSQNQQLLQAPPAHLKTISSGGTQPRLQQTPFCKESNALSSNLKRKYGELKVLEDFIVVEQMEPPAGRKAAGILRESADFNRMVLEYEYFSQGLSTRCVVKVEGQVIADTIASNKPTAKELASSQSLQYLKQSCWTLKTKQAVDSDTTISRGDIQKEIQSMSHKISSDNIGSKLLQKMGWTGGGVGKDGMGIAEPVSMMAVLNRQGLGLGTEKGITDNFVLRVRELVQNYASSENQDDLVFSCELDIDERKIIHDECRKLNLRSKSRGKGEERYLCVSRKRLANQLVEHVMACGGETLKYKLLPPGAETSDDWEANFDH